MKKDYTKDYNLAQSALLGNTYAWNTLYNNAYDIVCGYIVKHCRNTPAQRGFAEDIINEAFKRGYAHLNRYQGKSRFSTWVCGIAKNIILENNRETYKNIELINRIQHSFLYSEYMDPEYIAMQNEKYFCIWRAFYSLSEKHQALIQCIVLMDMPQSKAAKQAGLSLPECIYEYHNALECFRRKFFYMYYSKNFQEWFRF